MKNETAVGPHVYRKGAPNEVGWVMHGWGWSCSGGVGHAGVGWVMQGGVGHTGAGSVMQGWGGSYRGRVGHAGWGVVDDTGVGGVGLQACSGSYRGSWGGSCRVGLVIHRLQVYKNSLNNLIGHKLGILSFLLTNYFMNQSPHFSPA